MFPETTSRGGEALTSGPVLFVEESGWQQVLPALPRVRVVEEVEAVAAYSVDCYLRAFDDRYVFLFDV